MQTRCDGGSNGESPEDVARILGISRVTIYNWLALYRSGGWDALNANKRGGRKPKLDAKAMEWLYKAITNNTEGVQNSVSFL